MAPGYEDAKQLRATKSQSDYWAKSRVQEAESPPEGVA
jgi:hypothetical protein